MKALPRSRRFVAAALALGAVLSIAAVASAQESASPSAVPSASPAEPLEARPEGAWSVLAFDSWGAGLAEPRVGNTYTALFLPGGRLEGETGCGTYFGVYSLDAERIDLRVISKGPDPCDARTTEEAVAYSVALDLASTWRPAETGLELVDDAGVVRVVLGQVAQEGLPGSWVVVRYAKPNGKLIEPPIEDEIRLTFDAAGGVSGSTGCRLLEGSYESQGDGVVIAPVDTVGLPCDGDERKVERRLLRILDEVVLWARDGGRLVLRSGPGDPLLVLRPGLESQPSPLPLGSAEPTVEAG